MTEDHDNKEHVTRAELKAEIRMLRNDVRVWLIALLAGNQILNRTDLTSTATTTVSGTLGVLAVAYKLFTLFRS